MSASTADPEGPRGDPAQIGRAAGDLSLQSAGFSAMSQQLRTLPGSLITWQGPASVTFAKATLGFADDAAAAGDALSLVARVTQAFANELADAQAADRRARAERGRALQDIARANADIAKAQARASAAQAADGVPGAELIVRAALADKERAKRALKRAEDELKQAIADIREAEQRASRATSGLQQALQADIGFRGQPLKPLPALAARGKVGGGGLGGLGLGILEFFKDPSKQMTMLDSAFGAAPVLKSQARKAAQDGIGKALAGKAYRESYNRLTPAGRAAFRGLDVEGYRQINENLRKLPNLKRAARGPIVTLPASAYLNYRSNIGKMSKTENAMRTVSATVAGSIFAAGGALLCSPSTVGAIACAAGAGTVGSEAGGQGGGVAYRLINSFNKLPRYFRP